MDLIEIFFGFFDFLTKSFLLLAPMLLLGLLLSGLLHVFISRQLILKWFKKDRLSSVATSAAIGVPIPLCSCSVVPVVTEMRRKGASRSACMSFLITAPETGADSILVTNAFFGWIPAIARPIVSFITAVVAGLCCIGLIRDKNETEDGLQTTQATPNAEGGCGDHYCHEYLIPESDDCYIPPATLKQLTWDRVKQYFKRAFGAQQEWHSNASQSLSSVRSATYTDRLKADMDPSAGKENLSFVQIVKHVLKYGFVEIADDIFFALVLGLVIGAILYLALPADMMSSDYARWLAYPAMVLFGIPIYICASASTPIAAALVAKGLSPGAALVFLMTGPATNTGTIAIIVSQFGSLFASIYVGVVMVVTVVLGIAIDMLLLATGFGLVVNLEPSHAPSIQAIQILSAVLLLGLVLWRFKEGAFKQGYREFMENLRPKAFSLREK